MLKLKPSLSALPSLPLLPFPSFPLLLHQASILVGELASQFSVIRHQIDDPFLVSQPCTYNVVNP